MYIIIIYYYYLYISAVLPEITDFKNNFEIIQIYWNLIFHSCAFPGFRYETSPEEKKYLQITEKLPFGAQCDFKESTNVKKFFNELHQKDVKPSKRISFGTKSYRPVMPALLPTSRLGLSYPLNMSPEKPSKVGPGTYSIEKLTSMANKVALSRNRVWFCKTADAEEVKPPKSMSSRLMQSDINTRQRILQKSTEERKALSQKKSQQKPQTEKKLFMFKSLVPRDIKLTGTKWKQSIPGVGVYNVETVFPPARRITTFGGVATLRPAFERRCPNLKFSKRCSRCKNEPVGDYWENKATGEYLCRSCYKIFFRTYQQKLDFYREPKPCKKVRDLPMRPMFGGCQPITNEKTAQRENIKFRKEWYLSAFHF